MSKIRGFNKEKESVITTWKRSSGVARIFWGHLKDKRLPRGFEVGLREAAALTPEKISKVLSLKSMKITNFNDFC